MIKLDDLNLVDILPDSLKKDEVTLAIAEIVNDEFKKLLKKIEILDPRTAPPSFALDMVAYEEHVDFYDVNLPEQQKRALIENAELFHKRKGTPWAVEQALKLLNIEGTVREWYEYGGDPFYFRIETEKTLMNEDLTRLVKMVYATKNKRSWLEDVTIKRTNQMDLFTGGIISEWKSITLNPIEFKMPDLEQQQYVAGYISTWNQSTIKSESEVNANG
jgi:phage tail P2-like protein